MPAAAVAASKPLTHRGKLNTVGDLTQCADRGRHFSTGLVNVQQVVCAL